MDSPNIQWASEQTYLVGDRGTGAYGVKDIQFAVPETVIATENFETDPISGSGGGNLPWILTTSSPHTGLRCLRSGAITNSQQSLYTFTVPGGGVTGIRFWHRVSSESGFDFFEVYKDSVTVPNRLFQLSGTANVWAQLTLSTIGVTSIIFRYVKDSSDSAGLDTAFIDDIEWLIPPVAAIQKWEPLHLDTNLRLKVTNLGETLAVSGHVIVDNFPLEVEIKNDVGSPVPVSFARLTCATDSVEICNDAGSPISVQGTVALDAPTLAALETINVGNIPHVVVDSLPEVEIKNDSGSPIPVSGTVSVDNFPAVEHLDCITDSVTICATDPLPVTLDEPIDVNVLNVPHVVVDSLPEVEIKNDSGNPIPVSFSRLTCATDSVEICNDAGSPITVSGTVALDAGTLAALETINIGNIPHVVVDNFPSEVEIKNDTGNPVPVSFTRLDCATDSVTVCQDAPFSVELEGTVGVTGNVTVNDVYTPQAVFYATFGEASFNVAADSATGGRLWLVNTSSQLIVLREVRFTCVITSLIDLGSALPTLTLERMTFTGTPTGTQVTPCKRDSTDPSNVATLRTASTGMTITAGAVARKFAPPNLSVIGGLLSANTAVSVPDEQVFQPQDRRLIVLRQGEGLVFRQSAAGNATEGRSFMLNIMWEELP